MRSDNVNVERLAGELAEWLSTSSDVTPEDRLRAMEVLVALGVPGVLDELDLARRILRFGNSFHSTARFFADGSTEQRYLMQLTELAQERTSQPGP